ncbi:hypothetical protein [Nocardiopsis quinghaiensis]|uniref:hypothetical protein n=1 Tax=Nocardiopsis quinghaiensis TaxID=464995 RepID=UPI00123AD87A|nr:hypothetical protein [Nocardiopsis quinghaiensis]
MENRTEENVDRPGAPVAGILVAVVGIVLMALVSWTAWPDLPEAAHGGGTGRDGTSDTVPRPALVLTLPLSTALLTVVVPASTLLGHRLQGALGIPGVPTARSTTRGANVVLSLLAPLLLVVHGALVLGQAGWDVPILQVVGVATGLFLAAIGAALPRPEPGDGHEHPLVRWWAATHTPFRIALALVGLAQVAVALAVDHALVFSLAPLLVLPAMCAAMVYPLLRGRV